MARKPQFDISAAVVRQLGEELVSDEITAIVELVKNAYDADASFVHVTVETSQSLPIKGSKYKDETGYITIEDDGIGMDRDDIERGWLTISLSNKRVMKVKGQRTSKGRVPLGDKGLGRLSTQKLGKNLEMFTRKGDSAEALHVSFDWSSFSDDKSLSEVPVSVEPMEGAARKSGTTLAITGLRNPDVWRGSAGIELTNDLSQMISPFPEARPFLVTLRIDGRPIDLGLVSQRIRNAATGRFVVDFADGMLSVSGKVRLSKLRGNRPDDHHAYEHLLARDRGQAFFEYLLRRRPIFQTDLSEVPGFFLEFSHQVPLLSLGEVERDDTSGLVADPGPFHAEIDEFSLRPDDASAKLSGLNSFSDIQQMVKQHAGIKVFRDGFAIRPYGINGEDWLRLSAGQTSASSWYGLRPHNVIGFVAISEGHNGKLREKTDREGFVSNPFSQNFRRLMAYAVESIATFYEWVRRNYNTYKAEHAAATKPFQSGRDTVSGAADIAQKLANYAATGSKIQARTSDIEQRIARVKERIEATPVLSTKAERELTSLLQEAQSSLSDSHSILTELATYSSQAKELSSLVAPLGARLDLLTDQLQDFSELAGLGLLAESLSHEVQNQTDRIMQRASSNAAKARGSKPINTSLLTFASEMVASASALRKQISHLAPSLRYQRDKLERMSILELSRNIGEHFETRWREMGIAMTIACDSDFFVRTNRGRLTQVVDNVLLNSEYWLRQLRKKPDAGLAVTIQIDRPVVRIWDNGFGVDRAVEDALFEPFITLKPKATGRGLGLFISAQILESMGCSITLLGDRNVHGNRYVFALDLSGIVNG